MQPSDRASMRAVDVVRVQPCLRARPVVPVRLVHVALFRPNPEGRGLVGGEVQRGDRDLGGLGVPGVHELERLLWLREHVHEPAAYGTVGG